MRGTRRTQTGRIPFFGIIPAYAGNTRPHHPSTLDIWDHPRVCGEHVGADSLAAVGAGSSPRMRGTHDFRERDHRETRIIPAYAGNTLRDYSNFVVSKFMSFVFHLV